MNIPHSYQLFTAQESRDLDKRTISEFGISDSTLMEIAGTRAADFIMAKVEPGSHTLICCGRGNNAGDALVVARILAENDFQISVIFVDGAENLSPDCAKNWELLQQTGFPFPTFFSVDELQPSTYHFVVDGLLGTGLNSNLRPPYTEIVAWINEHSPLTFAMDVPTGLSANTGEILGTAVRADYTFAFGVLKLGFFIAQGYELCGEIILCELPFPSKFKNSHRFLLDEHWLHQQEKSMAKRTHKYDGGVVYVIAGSEGLTGAAALASQSAWATGVGAVVLITPRGLLSIYEKSLIQLIKKPVGASGDTFFKSAHFDEVTSALAEKPGVLLIGPGLGRNPETSEFARQILASFSGQVVIDADALFALSKSDIHQKPASAEWILTPHPGELSSLLAPSFNSDFERLELAQKFAITTKTTVVSKGLPSAIATKDGKLFITGYDTHIFARAGFGDVLAGKIAGFLLQKKSTELAASFSLIDGKSKADTVISAGDRALEPIDLI